MTQIIKDNTEEYERLVIYIRNRPFLNWYVKSPENLSEAAIVEATLNYGNFNDVRNLFTIISIKKAAAIFRKQISKPRHNYDKKIANYFQLYFDRYAPRDTQ